MWFYLTGKLGNNVMLPVGIARNLLIKKLYSIGKRACQLWSLQSLVLCGHMLIYMYTLNIPF